MNFPSAKKEILMPVLKASNFGNPYVGLFAKASESLAAADASASPKLLNLLEKLGVPVAKASFGGAGLTGIFLAMNSNGAILPSFCSNDEAAVFEKAGLNVMKLGGQFSAAGNNIAANDFGAIVNPEMPRSLVGEISDCLGVEAVPMRIAGFATVGSCVLATNSGFAAHNRASEEELKELHAIFKAEGSNCTLNTGVPFASLCAIANSHCAIIGEQSTGFEMGRIASALALDKQLR
jgi:translation initiation factor 6